MLHYRIFISELGGFRNSSNYEFVAEFSDQKMATNYMQYMFGKKRYRGKDIIIKEIDVNEFSTKDGCVACVLSSLGEYLPVGEYEFI